MTTREERNRRKKLIAQREYPNNCICDPATERQYGGPIIRTVLVEDPMMSPSSRSYPVRLCLRCQKEYVDAPAW